MQAMSTFLARWQKIGFQSCVFWLANQFPDAVRKLLLKGVRYLRRRRHRHHCGRGRRGFVVSCAITGVSVLPVKCRPGLSLHLLLCAVSVRGRLHVSPS